jgi:RNA polymerase sigma-70 factor (family 1)
MSERTKEELLFRKHYKSLCHFAWEITSDMLVAEDVVSDAFLVYFNQKDRISEDETAIKNFLYSTVRFSCYNLARQRKIVNRYWEKNGYLDHYDSEIENNIIRSEVLAEILSIVATLPNACQQVFRKGYLEGLSNAEIAEEMGIRVNTVKTQKQRGMQVLIKKLNPEFLALFIFFIKN